jgi:hypothetical protein
MKKLILIFLMTNSFLKITAQKKDTILNYLGIQIKKPDPEFFLFGKKDGDKIKTSNFTSFENAIRISQELEGYAIEEISIQTRKAASVASLLKNPGPAFNEEAKQQLRALTKGDEIIIQLQLRNRSTQLTRKTRQNQFFIIE